MKTSKWSNEQIQEVVERAGYRLELANERNLTPANNVAATDGVTRKSAIRKLNKGLVAKAAKVHRNIESPAVVARRNKKALSVAAKKLDVKTTPAGSARAEGLRLYKLAGRPTKNDFVHVYGKPGIAATWERRAAMVGLSTAEEAAAKFQSMRAKAAKYCLVTDEPKSQGASAK